MTIQEARIAVPPTADLKSNAAEIVAPSATDERAVTAAWNQLTAGSFDQGPVHATTTSTRITARPERFRRLRGRAVGWPKQAGIRRPRRAITYRNWPRRAASRWQALPGIPAPAR